MPPAISMSSAMAKPSLNLVTLAGVEPATCGLGNRRSIHLSYRATKNHSIVNALPQSHIQVLSLIAEFLQYATGLIFWGDENGVHGVGCGDMTQKNSVLRGQLAHNLFRRGVR